MALSGLHVACLYAGAPTMRHLSQPIPGDFVWSETPASGVTTTNAAPAARDSMGDPVFRIRTSADAWVSVGVAPNANANPRFLVTANEDYDLFVKPGDKLQWVAA